MEDLHVGQQSQLRRFGFEFLAERIDFASKPGDAVLQLLPVFRSDGGAFSGNRTNFIGQVVGGSICEGRRCEKRKEEEVRRFHDFLN